MRSMKLRFESGEMGIQIEDGLLKCRVNSGLIFLYQRSTMKTPHKTLKQFVA